MLPFTVDEPLTDPCTNRAPTIFFATPPPVTITSPRTITIPFQLNVPLRSKLPSTTRTPVPEALPETCRSPATWTILTVIGLVDMLPHVDVFGLVTFPVIVMSAACDQAVAIAARSRFTCDDCTLGSGPLHSTLSDCCPFKLAEIAFGSFGVATPGSAGALATVS